MKADSVEELFAALLELPKEAREVYLSAVSGPDLLKQTALRLVNAFESKSQFLNDDFLTDLTRVDPDFFAAANDEQVYQPGEAVGNYIVDSITGEGGMSVVYQARQLEPIERTVALKLIRPSVLAPKTVLRFLREQQALALVCHPNIATLFEVGTTSDGKPFAVMEFVDGPNIFEYCLQHAPNPLEKLRLLIEVGNGLSSAHQHGIVHRDVKPENILIGMSDGNAQPKLIDFGIAKFMSQGSELSKTMTQMGQVLGSPRYMSPEQIEGKRVDHRTDVFSAALVLFELLTLSPYRAGGTAESIVALATESEPELLSDRLRQERTRLRGEMGDNAYNVLCRLARRELDWVLAKALARQPEDRYATMDAFLRDLQAVVDDRPVSVVIPGRANRTWRQAKSNLGRIAIFSLIALLITSAIGMYQWRMSAKELTQIRQANRVSVKRNAASNDLLMSLLASNKYQLDPELFDLSLIPRYQGQYEQIQANGGPRSREDKTVFGILAVLHAMSGNFDQADQLLDQVDDAKQRSELRSLRKKICLDYAETAKRKLAAFQEGDLSLDKARQELTLGRCYVVLDMLTEAKNLIQKSIQVFDSNSNCACDSLVARNTLVKVFEQGGQPKDQLELLIETYRKFKDDRELLASRRGKTAFGQTTEALVTLDPHRFGNLKR